MVAPGASQIACEKMRRPRSINPHERCDKKDDTNDLGVHLRDTLHLRIRHNCGSARTHHCVRSGDIVARNARVDIETAPGVEDVRGEREQDGVCSRVLVHLAADGAALLELAC